MVCGKEIWRCHMITARWTGKKSWVFELMKTAAEPQFLKEVEALDFVSAA